MIAKIKQDLETAYRDKPHRLLHVYGVRDTALELGRKYKLNLHRLELAALLHDITKYYTTKEHINIIKKHYENSASILEEYNDKIIHAFSAAAIAKDEYQIHDMEVLNAIRSHTVGRPNMSLYEKIIFISDYIEPTRTYESCVRVREIVNESLDRAIYTAIDDSIRFHEMTFATIPRVAYEAREYYNNLLEDFNG